MTQQWKPISSAPKDGTEIIVFHPEAGVCAAFCPADGFAWHCMDGMNTAVGKKSGQSIPVMTSFLNPPTHWMPLPAAPCLTCGGHGMVGGLTPHSGYDAEPCQDCGEQATFDAKLGAHVRQWASRQGWKPEDAEGAWEFAQRLSYEAGRRHATPYWASSYEEQDSYDQAVADAIRRVKVRIEFAGRADISFPMTIPGHRVYLAGPMTGYENHNFPAFHAAAERLRASGLEVVNPADHGLVSGLGWADYMRWDLVKLAGCHSVYVLPGWEKSKGASLEVSIAQALGMPVFTVDGAALASAPVAGEVQPVGTLLNQHGEILWHRKPDYFPADFYAAPQASEAQHSDDAAVDRFAVAMKAKLAAKRAAGRGGWDDKAQCSNEWLSSLLRQHLEKGDPVDVGNFAMMLHQRGECIIPYKDAPQASEAVGIEEAFAGLDRIVAVRDAALEEAATFLERNRSTWVSTRAAYEIRALKSPSAALSAQPGAEKNGGSDAD